ncbi:MAG TPA: MBOAT family protein [Gammaproteobacteria bacterium]|nr:MBOAT family protein [Gammaproteobacteria bacterium]
MLFNSLAFIFLFLPVTVAVYFALNRHRLTVAAKAWLVAASLFFYSYWDVAYLPLMLTSILFNFAVGAALSGGLAAGRLNSAAARKLVLTFAIAANLGLLGFFKYADFFLGNVNVALGADFALLHIVLPLGISFFTFTQIAYLVDAHAGTVKENDYLNYSLFVTFFPHLLAGPILHHREMMPQFDSLRAKALNYKNLSVGLYLFFIGFFKKVALADTFATWANAGFGAAHSLTLIEAWTASLSYTLQLYFDFSGYTDMALGAALMLNIRLPINFNSPYRASSIQDFWRRWHITLSRFLRDYLYIPLGGNRSGSLRTYGNLMATFVLGGLWHGPAWTFVAWGTLHGAALVAHRMWSQMGLRMHRVLAWFVTFNFINLTWVFFRAKNWDQAVDMLQAMAGMNGVVLPEWLGRFLYALAPHGVRFGHPLAQINGDLTTLPMIAAGLGLALFAANSNALAHSFKPGRRTLVFTIALAIGGFMAMTSVTEFLYYNF